jgi:hypothetical protein
MHKFVCNVLFCKKNNALFLNDIKLYCFEKNICIINNGYRHYFNSISENKRDLICEIYVDDNDNKFDYDNDDGSESLVERLIDAITPEFDYYLDY